MSFITIRNKARNRFGETQVYLNYLTSLEPSDLTCPISLELKIMKGLFQVHLYAALEKTINELIETTLLYIGSNSIQNNHFSIPFNTISLIDRLKSFRDCGHKNFLEKSMEIFSEMTSTKIASINETIFANYLQNVWTSTIEEVMKSFGITGFEIDPRVRATINELVEKRNAVAHGRESATAVGERFRTDMLRIKMNTITDFSYKLIDSFELYYSNKTFLKNHAKKHYTITI
jgi:hypothetical protein